MHETHDDCALIISTQKDPITNAKSDYIQFHAWRCFKRSNWQYWVKKNYVNSDFTQSIIEYVGLVIALQNN